MYQIYFILEWHSTCFGRSFRPSSVVQDSNRHLSNRYCCLLASGYEVESTTSYPLASRQQYMFDKCLLLYVQSSTTDDGRKPHTFTHHTHMHTPQHTPHTTHIRTHHTTHHKPHTHTTHICTHHTTHTTPHTHTPHTYTHHKHTPHTLTPQNTTHLHTNHTLDSGNVRAFDKPHRYYLSLSIHSASPSGLAV